MSNIIDQDDVLLNECVGGGFPIYLQGGKVGKLISGGAISFVMNDLDINLSLSDSENQVKYSFKLNDIKELDEWLNSSDADFLAKTLRKFKIHFVYSNALKGLFFDIVHLFEEYVECILKLMYNDEAKINEKKQSWFEYDEMNNLESSSVILYQFGKDKDINAFLETKSLTLAAYIIDKDKWSYLGWCPYVPDLRYKALLNFPLELVLELLECKIDLQKLSKEFGDITKIMPPIINQSFVVKTEGKNVKQKSEALHNRIKNIEPILIEWESYYTKCAAQILEIAKIWQSNFQNFGK